MATPRHPARPYALLNASIAREARVTERDQTGPVIVGVDGSERSIDALALADMLGAALGPDVVIAHVHPFKQVSSLLAPGEYERLVREVAESTFDQVRRHLRSAPEPRMELVSDDSPAAGLHALAEREAATLIVIGSSHHSRIGRVLIGGTRRAASLRSVYARRRGPRWLRCRRPGDVRRGVWLRRVIGVVSSSGLGGRVRALGIGATERAERLRAHAASFPRRRRRAEDSIDQRRGASAAVRRGTRRVVGSRGYGPFRAVLLGSVSSALVRSAESPLVVVPRGGE
jgi:nucleotide-binding universal stress UspA family protein